VEGVHVFKSSQLAKYIAKRLSSSDLLGLHRTAI
jgi:hypothetical protein